MVLLVRKKANKPRILLADYCHTVKRRAFFSPETSRKLSNICRRASVIGVENGVCFLRLMHIFNYTTEANTMKPSQPDPLGTV